LGSAAVVSLSECEVVLDLEATVSFTANVSYRNPDATWDYIDANLDRTETVPVEVTIGFEPGIHLEYQVTATSVNNGVSIRIYLDDDAKTQRK